MSSVPTLQQAWNLVKHHKRAVIWILLSQLLITLIFQAVAALIEAIVPGILETIVSLLFFVINAVVLMMLNASGLYLMKRQILDDQSMSFAETFEANFTWFRDHWKQVWKPYLVWNYLLPFAVSIGFLLVFVLLIFGLSQMESLKYRGMSQLDLWMYRASALYGGWDSILSHSIGLLLFLGIFLTILFAAYSLILSAVGYRGNYAVGAAMEQKVLTGSLAGQCVKLALWPMAAVAAAMIVSVVLGILAALLMNGFSIVLLVLIVVVFIALSVFLFLYGIVVPVKILLDLENPALASAQYPDASSRPTPSSFASSNESGGVDLQQPEQPVMPPVFHPEDASDQPE